MQSPKALVADDEGLVSMMIEDILLSRGYAVTVVNTRDQLEHAVRQDGWTLAVADTDLATYEMQQWNVGTIVLCTGRTPDALEEEFPGIPYVTKPCNAEDFEF